MIPASTQVFNEIDARLNRILLSNGFINDIKSVNRSRKTKFMFTELPGINYYSTNETIDKINGAENHIINVSIEFINKSADIPFNDLAANMSADIVKALSEDATGTISPSLNDLVNSISISEITPIIEAEGAPYCGVVVDLAINYRTPILDHFTII